MIYQLDCLVFSDKLLEWCELDYDYIGAPLPVSKSDPDKGLSRAGNGGLSLRKAKSFLKVLDSPRYVTESVSFAKDLIQAPLPDIKIVKGFKKLKKKIEVFEKK